MPELPEIETIRNGLRRFILNKKIESIKSRDKKINLSLKDLSSLKNDSFLEIDRLGKLLIFKFKNNPKKLLIHLKMTGQLVFCSQNKLEKNMVIAGGHSEANSKKLNFTNLKHIRFEVIFKDKDRLILNDIRRFAYVRLVDDKSFAEVEKKFGLEPLNSNFSYEKFKKLIELRKNKNIKAFLLDQSLVAGIGNIYADEILFASGVRPERRVSDLNSEKNKKIFLNIKKIIKLAVLKRGTTFSDYVDAEGQSGGFLKLLKVYGRAGQKCKKCKNTVKKSKIAGRGTHYCDICQR